MENPTETGLEKSEDMPTVYTPLEFEENTYKKWVSAGLFHQEVDPFRKPFCIVIPPPNITGALHIGHALDNTLQDILIRWHRMLGHNTIWIPGTDHAGIATQVKVEASLQEEGLTRHDLGREEFIKRVWDWKQKYGGAIRDQLEKLGASCDWDRERFTMDEGLSKAVRRVFVSLYKKGLIYRGAYIVNWCPRCHTSLSDLEVEHEERKGALYYINYPFPDRENYVQIATTRPETMLGDTAIAVNPNDKRYRDIIGKYVILPIVNKKIPVIADEWADPEFGTGAVKVTPAHDQNDFQIGLRHSLPLVRVIDEDGRMTKEAGKYEGLDRYKCREEVVFELQRLGYLAKIEERTHSVGHCQRCHTSVEPLVSKQWFVKMKPLAEPAIKAVKEGKIKFVPDRFRKIYLNWMENVHDWCISRQLWWGHRIPVWYCEDCGETIVSSNTPYKCTKCGGGSLVQDPDVLDTWFSSALWPFSTMGWPEETCELKHFYPTSVLVTAYDIIFFWVARMIVMGLEFMDDVPFSDVLIHGLVRASSGKKMSKSLGTGIDPLEIIDEYGADVLRFALIMGNTPGNDITFREERLEASRNFTNKLWNASRFTIMNLRGFQLDIPASNQSLNSVEDSDLILADKWIRSRINKICKEVSMHLEDYEIGEAARTLYNFTWNEFCDWYIEIVKERLYSEDIKARGCAQYVLWETLGKLLRLLHPFLPFITEVVWDLLPHTEGSIMISQWPEYKSDINNPGAEKAMNLLMETIGGIRNIRSEMSIPPHKKIKAVIVAEDTIGGILRDNNTLVSMLSGLSDMVVREHLDMPPEKAVSQIVPGAEIYVPLVGIIDLDAEIQKLEKDLISTQDMILRSQKKLCNKGFLEKAKKEIIEKEKGRLADSREKEARLQKRLSELRE